VADFGTAPADATTTAVGERIPTVIVDDVHLIYRVYGASSGAAGSPVAAVKLTPLTACTLRSVGRWGCRVTIRFSAATGEPAAPELAP